MSEPSPQPVDLVTARALEVDTARVGVIDVLRGFSVLAVVIHHIHLRFKLGGIPVSDLAPKPVARVLFFSGYYAVITFFVISGFLITSLSMRRWGSLPAIRMRDFYALRAARIAPCLVLLVAILAGLHLAGAPGFVISSPGQSLPRAVVAAFGLHVNWLEGHYGYLPGSWDVLWSLSVEEMFYLAFPVCCVALRREWRLTLPLLALIVIGPINRRLLEGQEPWEDYAYLSGMDGMAFGCLAALVAARVTLGRTARRLCALTGFAAILLVEVFRPWAVALGLVRAGLWVSVLECGVALVMLGSAGPASARGRGEPILQRALAPLRALGRNSYELYLTHMFVVLWGTALFQRLALPPSAVPYWYVLELLCCVALGGFVARAYSAPLNRALRRRWLGRNESALAAAARATETAAAQD